MSENRLWQGTDPELGDLLRSQQLYKSLSLLCALLVDINVPASLLLLAIRRDLIGKFGDRWGFPLMIRMDYGKRPTAKPIGGIPLYKLDAVARICEHLINRGYVPLLHPHFDRFKNIYSSGVLLSRESQQAEIEVLGQGFDAGDLRLGKAIPHETLRLDLETGRHERVAVISDEAYRRERSARAALVRKLKSYTDFANRAGSLLSDLNQAPETQPSLETEIPARYEAMPVEIFSELSRVTRVIHSEVLRKLPPAKTYVASLSYLANGGWVLWDVYGEWYQR